MFAMVFMCNPVEEFWLLTNPFTDKCDFPRGYIIAVGNIVTDFLLVLVPMPVVFQLNIKTPQKFCFSGEDLPQFLCNCCPFSLPHPVSVVFGLVG